MTLIEIVIVLTLIVGIMTLVGTRVIKQLGKANVKKTEISINQLAQAIAEYQMDNSKIPQAGEGLNALVPDYIEKVPVDSWGHELHYSSPGPNNMPYDISSDGVDGQSGTDDDVSLSKIKSR